MKKGVSIAVATVLTLNLTTLPILGYATESETKNSVRANTENTTASVQPFSLKNSAYLADYEALFKIDSSHIQSIKNNGGIYHKSLLDYAIDGDTTTHWETGKPNSDTFTNEVIFTFNDTEELNRIIYTPRPGGKGFAQQFEIYTSTSEAEDDFTRVTVGEYTSSTNDTIEIQFANTEFKRLKFVFKKANANWAAAGEFSFYKQDQIAEEMNSLFSNNLMAEVSTTYNSPAKIEELEKQIAKHPLSEEYKSQISLAKKIVNGELQTEGRIITAEQRGNMASYAQQTLKMPYGSNSQPTGIAALVGEELTVYVEADSTQPLPQLMFTQQEGSWNAWNRTVNLKPGKNVFTVPAIYTGNVTQGGAVYIINPYTAEQQKKAPVLRFEGGERFPLFKKGDDVAVFKSFLETYQQRLAKDVEAHPEVKDRQLIDVTEIMSDRILFTGTASEAYKQFITNDVNPQTTVSGYDRWIKKLFDFTGFDSSKTVHTPGKIRENIRLMQPYGAMYAAGNHTGIQRSTVPFLFSGDFSKTYPGWGLTHEIGHRMAVGMREYGEVTNNMVSMAMSVEYNALDNRIPYETIYKHVIKENQKSMTAQGLSERLGAFWQLELAHPGYWAELNKLYREQPVSLPEGDYSKQQYLIQYSSQVLEQDLSSYFARHGFTVGDDTKEKTSIYEAPTKIWYLNNSVISYKGHGFTEDAQPQVDLTHAATKNTISLEMDPDNQEHVLGYEIYRDGKLLAFTATNSFTEEITEDATYQVVAYDKKLKALEAVEVHTTQPELSIEHHVTIPVNSAFTPSDYVTAKNSAGDTITDKVSITSNVDTKVPGDYTVTFELPPLSRSSNVA
ncbi:M60 family metallopeptidase [Kurthia populi]|uniref:M60 family metallopeptidase n=1 Tax=Kurthia populi TaxID=1562132 RepID=A0ABW5XXB8_9BACL